MTTVDFSRLGRTLAATRTPATAAAAPRTATTVLIVDQDPDSRLETARLVQGVGFSVVGEAAYGTEATVTAVDTHPDLILLAITATSVRSISTLQALQASVPAVPVVAYSALADPDLMRLAMRAGARDFLKLPLRPDAVLEAAQSVLAQERRRPTDDGDDDQTAARARGTIITVAGAKGGIGKTTLAINLALALRTLTAQEVALVDSDAQFGDVGVMLDLNAERGIADLAREERVIDRRTVAPYLERYRPGVDVLPVTAQPDDWRAVDPQQLRAIVGALAETHEFVVIDTPGVMTELVQAALQAASIVLLVTTLDISSIKDTKTALRMFEAWGLPATRVRIVINDANRSPTLSARDVAEAIGMDVALHLQHASQVGLAVQAGAAVIEAQPACDFSHGVMAIARALAGVDGAAARGRARPLLRRLSRMGGRS